MRRAARVDANQSPLVTLARQLGMLVYVIREPVDLLVGVHGIFLGVEVKDGSNGLTDAQATFKSECQHRNLPFQVWRDTEDVIRCAQGICGGEG